jgi:DNA-binding CsgD family transcriptional regulator
MPRKTDTGDRIVALLNTGAKTSGELAAVLGVSVNCITASITRLLNKDIVIRLSSPSHAAIWALHERVDGSALWHQWPVPGARLPQGRARVVKGDM